MQNRRDQVQAHQFVVSRLTTGLLRGNPDSLEVPNRRTRRGILSGAAAGALVCLGALVLGLATPGGSGSWRNGQTLLVVKETGTRYLFDGKALRPVRNYASARLIVGAQLTITTASAQSLAGIPHGDPVGLLGAPDGLPAASQAHSAWDVCGGTQQTDSGSRAPATALAVGADLPGRGLQGNQAVLVSAPDGTYNLIWQGKRLRMSAGSATANALGYGVTPPLPVSAAFLDALPAGADLVPPHVDGAGQAGPVLNGHSTTVGQIFVVQPPGTAAQYYLLQNSGLTPITATLAALALSAPEIRKAYGGSTPTAVALPPDALNSALAPQGAGGAGAGNLLPATPPALVPVDGTTAVCASFLPSASGTAVGVTLIDPSQFPATAVTALPDGVAAACLRIDTVSVPSQSGGLVKALGGSGGAEGGTTYVVTDTGVKYLIPDQNSATALGYTLAGAPGLPSSLLDMLPTGPELAVADAQSGQARIAGTLDCGQPAK